MRHRGQLAHQLLAARSRVSHGFGLAVAQRVGARALRLGAEWSAR
jgi:hypothetical protein